MVCSNTPEEEMNFITYLVITFNKRAKTGWLAEKLSGRSEMIADVETLKKKEQEP
jgi:hypothetical protein